MSNLKGTIESLASTFAANLLSAFRSASIDELSELTGGRVRAAAAAPKAAAPAPRAAAPAPAPKAAAKPAPKAPAPKATPKPVAKAFPKASGTHARRTKTGRLGRRSEGDIAGMIERIVSTVTKAGTGLRAEEIRKALGVEAKELPRPLADAVDAGRLTKSGQKRATTYFAAGAKKSGKKR